MFALEFIDPVTTEPKVLTEKYVEEYKQKRSEYLDFHFKNTAILGLYVGRGDVEWVIENTRGKKKDTLGGHKFISSSELTENDYAWVNKNAVDRGYLHLDDPVNNGTLGALEIVNGEVTCFPLTFEKYLATAILENFFKIHLEGSFGFKLPEEYIVGVYNIGKIRGSGDCKDKVIADTCLLVREAYIVELLTKYKSIRTKLADEIIDIYHRIQEERCKDIDFDQLFEYSLEDSDISFKSELESFYNPCLQVNPSIAELDAIIKGEGFYQNI